MAKRLLTDQLWERIESSIPSRPPRPQGGRPPIPDRRCLTGILFVSTLIAGRNTDHGSALGRYRCVVEAAFAWLFKHRRLRVRCEKRDDIHEAFLKIGYLLICWNRVFEFC